MGAAATLIVWVTAACASGSAVEHTGTVEPDAALGEPVEVASGDSGLVASLRARLFEPTDTATPTATSTPSITPTRTPRPTSTPRPHPLSIDLMRDRSYSGSDLKIEQTLAPGAGYDRHVVSYRSDSLKQYAFFTVPHGDPPQGGWPVIVFNHGYIPPREYRTTERYVSYVDAFARNGYIVIKPDYRGHGSSQGLAMGGYSSPDYTVDVLNAAGSVRRWPTADPDRVGMWGHSMGGHITLRSMVVTNTIKAGVIWAGVVVSYPDLFTRWHRSRGSAQPTQVPYRARRSWRDSMSRLYGAPADSPGFWSSISANSYVDDISGPLQLHHGTGDAVVPFEFSEILLQEVLDVGGAAELVSYDGDDHNLSANLGTALQRSVEYFDRHVKGDGR